MKKYKIYLDVCCLNRPFDDQSQDRTTDDKLLHKAKEVKLNVKVNSPIE